MFLCRPEGEKRRKMFLQCLDPGAKGCSEYSQQGWQNGTRKPAFIQHRPISLFYPHHHMHMTLLFSACRGIASHLSRSGEHGMAEMIGQAEPSPEVPQVENPDDFTLEWPKNASNRTVPDSPVYPDSLSFRACLAISSPLQIVKGSIA